MRALLLVSFIFIKISQTLGQLSGPVFIEEPPNIIEFSNSSGTVVQCRAGGEPKPIISWKCNNHSLNSNSFDEFGNEVMVRSDGALILAPFSAHRYRKRIHSWARFQCIATNKFGSIASREVRVNAALLQAIDIRVFDEFVFKGNVAVVKCLVQNQMSNSISNFIWHISDGLVIKTNQTKGKYTVYSSGELHVRSVDENDLHKTYRCEAWNRLTAQSLTSQKGGQLILSDVRNTLSPRIVHRKSEIIAEENDQNVMIPCAAEANPSPKYSWHKSSEFGTISSIQMSERILILDGTLVLSRISVTDSGRYLAIVSNSVGEDRCITDLIVRSSLKVIIYPNAILQSTRGQSVNISCRVEGFPVDNVYWTHDLKTISGSNSNQRAIDIHIESIRLEHIGMYQCFASNRFESVQKTIQMTLIDESPRIIHAFEEKIVNEGNTISISCTAIGSPLAQIQWTVDGHSLPNLIRFRSGDYVTSDNKVVSYVNITSIRVEDGGRYRCSATNSIGQTYYENRINVYGPPAVKSASNLTVLSGSTAHLFCPYYGYPISSIDWTNKDGRTLPLNGRQLILGNGTLIINDVNKKADEGLYECSVRQANLRANTYFNLKVMVGPRIDPFNFPKDLEEGMRNVVICAVLAGDSPISIKWLKDEHELPDDLEVEMVNEFTSSITFNSLRTKHSGQYTCIASNNAAKANHSSSLVVNMAPIWVKEPTDVETIVGQMVVIDCQAEGIPEPQIRWKRMQINDNKYNWFDSIDNRNSDDLNVKQEHSFKTITSNPHIQILENGSLLIKDVNQSDQTKYICSASNGVNPSISSIIRVIVKSPPQLISKFESLTVKKGETIRLQCNPIGDNREGMEIQWKKNSIGISSNSEKYKIERKTETNLLSELIISSAERFDSAIFTCIAINRFGSDEKNFRVIVQELPDPPFDLKCKTVTSNSVRITWSQPYNGNDFIVNYKVEYKSAEHNSWSNSLGSDQIMTSDTSAEIKNLVPFTYYDIRVCAINSLGKGEFSELIKVRTLEEAPSLPPKDVKIVATSARSLKVLWRKPNFGSGYAPTIKGYYVGYRLHGSDETFVFKTIDASLETDREEYEINNLIKFTKYDIRVQAFNSVGSGPSSDDLVGQTLEFDVPNAPLIRVLSTSSDSIELEWSVFGDEPISGFIISYRGEDKEWKVLKTSTIKTFTIYGLKCGKRYQIYMNAFNTVGQSDSSDVILARTEGNAPTAPEKSVFIQSNSSSVGLNLNSWKSIGCKINYFIIKYKKQLDHEWTQIESSLDNGSEKPLVISDLKPGQWYNLLVTGVSDAGQTDAEYLFSTLTSSGATIAPLVAQTSDELANDLVSLGVSVKWLLSQLNFVIPITCALIIVILVTVVICILQFKNNTNHEMLTIAVNDQKEENQISCQNQNKSRNSIDESFVEMTDNQNENQIESIYLPIPYATSRLAFITQSNNQNDCDVDQRQTVRSNRNHVYDVPFLTNKASSDGQYSCVNKCSDKLDELSASQTTYESNQLKPCFGGVKSEKKIFF